MGNEASSPTTTGAAAAGEGSHEEKLRAIRQMDSTIRQRLKGGVSYNMKVVLRGERGSGKSALLARLQGLPFKPEYAPTPEIQTATISWTGTAEGADAVKVEVWDVVDRGIRPGAAGRGQGHRKKRSGNTMLAAPADEEDEEEGGGAVVVEDDDALAGIPLDLPMPPPASGGGVAGAGQHVALGLLDARMVDVYKQSQCAVFLVNPFSASALAYLGKEVPAVPRDIPVLLLLNFRDLLPLEESSRAASSAAAGHRPVHVTLAALRGVAAAEAVRRGAGARPIHAFACSMQNCFGLRALYQYLNLPFLAMKEALLARQLAATKEELAATGAAVGAAIEGESWPAFLQSLRQEEREPATGASAARAPAALRAAAAPAAPVPQQQPAPRMGTVGQGVGESKRSSSSAAASSRRPPPPPPEQRPSRSATPSADGAGGAAALADVDDFAYRPTAARSELDDFLADAEDDEEERAEYAAALAARREEERRRASIAACLKPEAEAVVDDGEDKEEEEDEEVGGLGRSSSSSQRYAGLAPVHLDTSGGSVGSSLSASAPTVVVAPACVAEAAAQQEEQHQQPATAAAADVTEEAPAAPEKAEGEQQQEEQEEAAESPAAPPAAPAPTMAVEEDEDDLDDEPAGLGPGIAEVEDGASGGEDDDEPAGLPIAGQGVPAGFFDDDEEEEDGGFETGIGGMGGIGGVPARPPAYPRPSGFQPASSGPSAPTKPSDAALAAAPKSGSSSGALSEAARAAIAMTMASLEQELGGSGSGSGSLAVTAQGGAQEAGERSGSSSSRKKHHAKEEKHERKKSSSSRKHKKKSSSDREGR